jgi:competence protein ComEC
MTSRSLGQRAPLLWVLLPLMAGLVAGKAAWLPLTPVWWAGLAVIAAAWAVAGRRGASAGLVVAVFMSGAALYEVRRERLPDWDNLPPREVRLTLEVDRLFPPHPDGRSLSGLGRLHGPESHLRDLEGQPVYFSVRLPKGAFAPPHPASMPVTGVLQPLPRNAPVDTFDGYLVGQGMNFTLTRAQITGPVTAAGAYQVFCDNSLERFSSILGRGVAANEARAGVLRAMLLGRHEELTDAQKELFRASGTMHLLRFQLLPLMPPLRFCLPFPSRCEVGRGWGWGSPLVPQNLRRSRWFWVGAETFRGSNPERNFRPRN